MRDDIFEKNVVANDTKSATTWLYAIKRLPANMGPRTAGRRLYAVQAFFRRQNLGVDGIHFRRAFEIPLGWSDRRERNPTKNDMSKHVAFCWLHAIKRLFYSKLLCGNRFKHPSDKPEFKTTFAQYLLNGSVGFSTQYQASSMRRYPRSRYTICSNASVAPTSNK